jgi:hypothetical protein
MAPRLKAARLGLGSRGTRNLGDGVRRNKIANLAQDAELGTGWSFFELIHPCRVAGANKKLQPFLSNPMGWLCFIFPVSRALTRRGHSFPTPLSLTTFLTAFNTDLPTINNL